MSQRQRQQKELEELGAMGQDLRALAAKKYLVAGIQIGGCVLQTPVGPGQGVVLKFHMQDGSTVPDIILDVIGVLNLMHGAAGVLTGQITPQGPAAPEPPADPTTTTSGLVIP